MVNAPINCGANGIMTMKSMITVNCVNASSQSSARSRPGVNSDGCGGGGDEGLFKMTNLVGGPVEDGLDRLQLLVAQCFTADARYDGDLDVVQRLPDVAVMAATTMAMRRCRHAREDAFD